MAFTRERVPTSEQLLIDALRERPVRSALCTSLGRGQVAAEIANRWTSARVSCHFLDLYRAQQAGQWLGSRNSIVQVTCTADFTEEEFDLVALPCTAQGDGELTRDLIQSGFVRLRTGGQLMVATDNPRDTWLGEVMGKLFGKTTRSPGRAGTVYSGIKTEPLRKLKDYGCEFVFRDGPRLVRAYSRPGVFSHRRLDVGARALIETMEISGGQRIFDLGCGAGVVSLAAALRADNVVVTAIDANPRAIECTRRGAELNQVTNITACLNADAYCESPKSYDIALANPPYYSNFRIGEIFVRGAENALRTGGQLLLVTKQPNAYMSLLDAGFHDATVSEVRRYFVLRAIAD